MVPTRASVVGSMLDGGALGLKAAVRTGRRTSHVRHSVWHAFRGSPDLCSTQLCCTSRDDKHQLIASEARKNKKGPGTPSKLCGIGVGLDPVLLARNQGALVMSMAENGALYAG